MTINISYVNCIHSSLKKEFLSLKMFFEYLNKFKLIQARFLPVRLVFITLKKLSPF